VRTAQWVRLIKEPETARTDLHAIHKAVALAMQLCLTTTSRLINWYVTSTAKQMNYNPLHPLTKAVSWHLLKSLAVLRSVLDECHKY